MLTFLDEYTCQALCVEVRDKLNSDDVIEVIQRLLLITSNLNLSVPTILGVMS